MMPEIAAPATVDEAIDHLSNADTISDMVWVLGDWNELANWLSEFGAPNTTEEGLLPTSIERVKWVIENVEKTTLVGE